MATSLVLHVIAIEGHTAHDGVDVGAEDVVGVMEVETVVTMLDVEVAFADVEVYTAVVTSFGQGFARTCSTNEMLYIRESSI